MKLRFIIRQLFVLMVAVVTIDVTSAQELDYDYRAYKYYDEDDELVVELDADSLSRSIVRAGDVASLADEADYSLRTLCQNSILAQEGVARNLRLDYSSSRLLSQLGVGRDRYYGLGTTDEALCVVDRYLLGCEHRARYASQSARVELSGRGYIVGVSHKATYKPERDGIRRDGDWVITHYARVRTGRDIYVEGVYGNMMDLAAEASWGDRRNDLSLVVMLPWSERGMRTSSVEEAFSLIGDRWYNPLWGVQDGRVRNSRVATTLRPELLAVWDRRLSVSTTMRITTNIYGENQAYTSLAWFNAPTPMPDNYHYLPSYYSSADSSAEVLAAWRDNNLRYTQIDWDRLYHTNSIQSDGHARYAVESRESRGVDMSLLASFITRLKGVNLEYGVSFVGSSLRYFKVMDDLLGATHIIDKDYYLIDDASYGNRLQNDLRHPNRRVEEGDRFGYDYRMSRYSTTLYGRADWRYGNMSLAVDARVATVHTWRRGYYEKELYSGAGSYGKSQSVVQNPYLIALLWGYDMQSHYAGLSVAVEGQAFGEDEIFLQPQYNNRVAPDVALATYLSAKGSYLYRPSSRLGLQANLFVVSSYNERDVFRCYDDLSGDYADVVISGIERLNLGVDLRAEVGWNRFLSSNFRIIAASNRYSDNADVVVYSDADNHLIASTTAMVRGCRVGTPALSAYGDLLFSYAGWAVRPSIAWSGMRYVSPSFVRRTERVLSYVSSVESRDVLMHQEHLPAATSLDLSISKRMKLNDVLTLNFQFSVRNILNSSGVYGGYEQDRVRRVKAGYMTHLSPFANKLTYAYPRTFYLSLSLWF